jgi:iron complex outermembrane receptor protein
VLASSAFRSSLIALALRAAWASDQSNELQGVVVTANRTAEDIQAVPVDISVVSGQLANAIGITDLQSLAGSTPGLLGNRGANAAIPFIRGVGSPLGIVGNESSVAFYVDDVYESAASGALANFSSVDRIEIEKGPQGTVFGRNATGGVIQVFTRDPTIDPQLDVTVGEANYDTQAISLYATGPLAGTLTGNVAMQASRQHQGWGHNVVTGESIYTGWDYGARVKLLWTPAPGTSALLNVDYDDTRTEEGINLRAWPGTTSFNPAGAGIPAPAGYYEVNAIPQTHSITYQSGASLKLIHDFRSARLVDITAWRNTKNVTGVDQDPGIALANGVPTTEERTWTEEIRLSSAQPSKSSWISGLFFYHDVSGYDPLYLYGSAFFPLPYINTFGIQTTDSWAGFAQGRREILKDTDLTLGVRYTADHRHLQASTQVVSSPRMPVTNSPQSATWSEPTYRVALEHRFTDDLMVYIAYNRGFRSGAFNTTVLPGSPIAPPVAPETLDAYTVGAKSDLLGGTLRLDLEGFYYNYRNIQIDQIVAGAVQITNAAAATIRGIDIDAAVKPVTGLTITASMEVLSGRYTSFRNGQFYMLGSTAAGSAPRRAARLRSRGRPPNRP